MNLDPVPPVALVVDDEPVARLMVKLSLERLGCTPVLEAADGIDAQQVLREHPEVALVLTDIMMPRMDGNEFLRQLKQNGAGVPVIVQTAFGNLETALATIVAAAQRALQATAALLATLPEQTFFGRYAQVFGIDDRP